MYFILLLLSGIGLIGAITLIGKFFKMGVEDMCDTPLILVYIIGVILCLVPIIAGPIVQLNSRVSQISDSVDIEVLETQREIYQRRADILTEEFTYRLAVDYPEYEERIFENIRPDNVSTYLAMYPELRSADTYIELVSQTRDMQDQIYEIEIEIEGVLGQMRFRTKDPWIFMSHRLERWLPERVVK